MEEALNSVEPPEIADHQTLTMSEYERSRQERIKANLERMQKLGIVDLSLKLKSLSSPPQRRTPKKAPSSAAKRASPLPDFQSSEPRRRSSRLQNATPVSYSEAVMAKKGEPLEDQILVDEGPKPEIYTEEHEKLLGSTERSWTLFVDGYAKDGKRIYDPVKGKTCHQCRQKTLGYRTDCSQCGMVQGQFCGDCLYMRYGEHVLEALENPDWTCPVCRGICNCSLCRHGKGWAPTGTLYKKITSLGYKSVAHYLIQTRRAQNTEQKNSTTVNTASAKRSLPFSEMETPTEMSPETKTEVEDKRNDGLKTDEQNPTPVANKENESESKVEEGKKVKECDDMGKKLARRRELVFEPTPESVDAIVKTETDTSDICCEVKQPVDNILIDQEVKDGKHACDGVTELKNSPTAKKKHKCEIEPNADSIGARLRQRRRMIKN